MPGVWHFGFVDMWSPGYLGFAAANHNGMLRMYEIFNQGGANTKKARLSGGQTTRQWYRPNPAPAGEVDWSIRNSINYAQTGVLTALELTSKFPAMVVENYYKKSANAMKRGADKPPHAFVIAGGPARSDARSIASRTCCGVQAIEVHRATAEIKVKEGTFPAGSYIVKLNQPYGPLAKTLLEKQTYPDASLTTYDDSAWTMGMANNIEVKTIEDKTILDAPATLLTADVDDRGHRLRHRADLRRQAQRRAQPDHAALSPEGCRHEGREGGVQDRRHDYPGRLADPRVGRRIARGRKSSRSVSSPSASAVGAHRSRPSTSICRASRCTRPGPTPRRSAGCGSRSIASEIPVRSDSQGSRAGRRQPAREVRRDRDAAPDQQRQVDRLRAAEAVEAAALQEERQVQVDGHVRRNRRRARRHGPRGRGGVPEVRGRGRRADDARRGQLLPRRVRHRQGRRRAESGAGLLCAGTVRAERDPDADPSGDVRLRPEDAAGSLCTAGRCCRRVRRRASSSSPERHPIARR